MISKTALLQELS